MKPVRALLSDQIERLWGQGEVALVRTNYRPDVVDHMPVPGQAAGLDALAGVVDAFRAGLPDMRMTLDGTVVAGEYGVDWWTLEGTNTGVLFGQPPTGRRVRIEGTDMIRVEGGQVADLWHVEDMAAFEAQLAGTPPPPPGFADRHTFAAALDRAASDVSIEVRATLREGDRQIEHWTASGRHDRAPLLDCAPAGARFAIAGFDIRSGDVTIRHVAERAQLRAQLTAAP